MEEIYLTDGDAIKGPKHEFYCLWDQNENLKLIKGPNDILSYFYFQGLKSKFTMIFEKKIYSTLETNYYLVRDVY